MTRRAGEGGIPAVTGKNMRLVGREEESFRLRELVASPYTESRVLLLLGDPGVGKPTGGPGDSWAHGFLFQHHAEFAADVETFLSDPR